MSCRIYAQFGKNYPSVHIHTKSAYSKMSFELLETIQVTQKVLPPKLASRVLNAQKPSTFSMHDYHSQITNTVYCQSKVVEIGDIHYADLVCSFLPSLFQMYIQALWRLVNVLPATPMTSPTVCFESVHIFLPLIS